MKSAIAITDNFIYSYTDGIGFDCGLDELRDKLLDNYLGCEITYAMGRVHLNPASIDYIVLNSEQFCSVCKIDNEYLRIAEMVNKDNEDEPINEANNYDSIFHRVRERCSEDDTNEYLTHAIDYISMLVDNPDDRNTRSILGGLLYCLISYGHVNLILVEHELEQFMKRIG